VKTLIVDDHEAISESIGRLITGFGNEYRVQSARTVASGLEQLSVSHFDFVLSDLYLGSNTPTFAVIDAARERGVASAVLSAVVSPELMEQAYRAGALSYLSKSLPLDALGALIHLAIVHNVSHAPLLFRSSASVLEHVESMPDGAKKCIRELAKQPGLDHKSLARLVGLSPATVKTYMAQWIRVFGVGTSAAAADEFKKVYGIN
jgi:DNA-binding NarL/FixJ family response regulator